MNFHYQSRRRAISTWKRLGNWSAIPDPDSDASHFRVAYRLGYVVQTERKAMPQKRFWSRRTLGSLRTE
jgi:hypothetical protein